MNAALTVASDSRTALPVAKPGPQRTAMRPANLSAARFRLEFSHRIRTDSVYHPRTRGAYSLLIARCPHFTHAPPHYSQLAPGLAPRDIDGVAYQLGDLSWEIFARRYWRDLTALPHLLTDARRQVTRLLERYPTLTFLGFQQCTPGEECAVHCVRRLVRAWLLGETPIEITQQ